MKISKIEIGTLSTNTYVVVDEFTGMGAVIDPALYTEPLRQTIKNSGMKELQYIILTHGHSDHILGVYDMKKEYPNTTVVIHKEDDECLNSTSYSLAEKLGIEQHPMHADKLVGDGDEFVIGESLVKVISTPGHTPGSVCYIIGNIMFSGDTLFCRTCGRTDFFRGSAEDMQNSIDRLGHLPGDYIVYPGHGPNTTLDVERKTNRFMRKKQWS